MQRRPFWRKNSHTAVERRCNWIFSKYPRKWRFNASHEDDYLIFQQVFGMFASKNQISATSKWISTILIFCLLNMDWYVDLNYRHTWNHLVWIFNIINKSEISCRYFYLQYFGPQWKTLINQSLFDCTLTHLVCYFEMIFMYHIFLYGWIFFNIPFV